MKLEQSDLDAAVTWTLSRAARAVERRLTTVIAAHGITAVQFGVLVQLATNNSMTRAELARATMVRPQSMAGVIEGMAEQRMLRFVGTSGRGRANPVMLTDSGEAIVDVVWPAFVEANKAKALGLDENEAASLNLVLHRLREL